MSNDDFLLVLQTKFQCKKAVCIDSTHGTNAYHFIVTTIMVSDDYGEGLPVGWMISNKDKLFTAIKERIGVRVFSYPPN